MAYAHQGEWIPSDERLLHAAAPTTGDVFTIQETLDVAASARLLRDMKLHYLLVTDHGEPPGQNLIGVLTEGDIVAAVAREADPRSVRAGDVMTRLVSPVPMERALAALPERRPRNVIRIDTQYAHLHGLLASVDAIQRTVERLRNAALQLRNKSAL